jgi:hypothetical protein
MRSQRTTGRPDAPDRHPSDLTGTRWELIEGEAAGVTETLLIDLRIWTRRLAVTHHIHTIT